MTHEHDRDTVVVSDGGGSGVATILGVLLIIALLAAVWWFTLGPGAGSPNQGDTQNPDQPVPSVQLPASS